MHPASRWTNGLSVEQTVLTGGPAPTAGSHYQGGDPPEVRDILEHNIAWQVPGDNEIAGNYHGHDEVIAYLLRRCTSPAPLYRLNFDR